MQKRERPPVHDPMVIQLQQRPVLRPPIIEEPREEEEVVRPRKRRGGLNYSRIALLVLILTLCILGAYGAYRYMSSPSTEGVPQQEVLELVEKVGKLLLLPQDEQPTIATVTDLNSLKGQLFFKNARLGDVVLMYSKAQKAILYNPLENKIIEVAPITIDAQ